MKRVLSFIVPKEYDGASSCGFLSSFAGLSGSLIRRIKKYDNGLTQNGVAVRMTQTVQCGDRIVAVIDDGSERSENIPPCEEIPDIVYEDDDIVIVNKGGDMPIHPSIRHYYRSLAGVMINYYNKQGENFVFRCVNRLDKGTSGLTVIAKNAYSHDQLRQQLHTDGFLREYLAIAVGEIDSPGYVEAPISRAESSIIRRCVSEDGDYAYTEYEPVSVYNGATLVRLRLKTGRTHQIRVHMSYIGHPLVGDFLYGTESELISRPALHSAHILLNHPVTGKLIDLSAPLPHDMESLKNK